MSGPKKRKVDSECLIRSGQQNIFFTEVLLTAVCLICQETVAFFKEYNISHHFATKHADYASKQSMQERVATAQRMMANLQTQQNFFSQTNCDSKVKYQGKFYAGIQISKGYQAFL